MRIFGVSTAAAGKIPGIRYFAVGLGIAGLLAVIWFGLPLIPVAVFSAFWFSSVLSSIVVVLAVLIIWLRWRRRKRANAVLEDVVAAEPIGDGAILAERMRDALTRLKKSGAGSTYLYDKPWYIIIGPPGAGKTTALKYSGIPFPGQDIEALAGSGGTRNCEFWFASDAVLLDTAGRYTMHDSDARADRASWLAFLEELKRKRPEQPINGVILAISAEDMREAVEATDRSAQARARDAMALSIRSRLTELHETLRIDIPVYVMFTKTDMIAGFREYFAKLPEESRRAVWGTTFQTKARDGEAYSQLSNEFDAIVERISLEAIDRMVEEKDPLWRMDIFAFPDQMMRLKRSINDFVRRIFENSKGTGAILRGVYFTSGTQEGTPIDQVLGKMAKARGESDGSSNTFMSGRGRSYFLHDLLTKVIFEEKGWVGHDRGLARRRGFLRAFGFTAVGLATLASLAVLTISFVQNRNLVAEVAAATNTYVTQWENEIEPSETITDPDPTAVLVGLNTLRRLPAGYEDTDPQDIWQQFGLARKNEVRASAVAAYERGLEAALRPRLVAHLESVLPQLRAQVAGGDTNITSEIYGALKVYLLLTGAGSSDDEAADAIAVRAYFSKAWMPYFESDFTDERFIEALAHLDALIAIPAPDPRVAYDATLVADVRSSLRNMRLEVRAWSLIQAGLEGGELNRNWTLEHAAGRDGDIVFRVSDGGGLRSVEVPWLFTFEGYWGHFQPQIRQVADRLRADAWVLGDDVVGGDRGLTDEAARSNLQTNLHGVYEDAFLEAWTSALDRIELAPMASRRGVTEALGVASREASPLVQLTRSVALETQLSSYFKQLEDAKTAFEIGEGGNIVDRLVQGGVAGAERRANFYERILLEQAAQAAGIGPKSDRRVGEQGITRQSVLDLERPFVAWHDAALGEPGARVIDTLVSNLDELRISQEDIGLGGAASSLDREKLQFALANLNGTKRKLPKTLENFVDGVVREFRNDAADATMEELEVAFINQVARFCRENLRGKSPFSPGAKAVSISAFGEFFGNGGRMDSFFQGSLASHVQVGASGGLEPRSGSAIGERLSPQTLRAFEHADAIRAAFFPPGAREPKIRFLASRIDLSRGARSMELTVGGARKLVDVAGVSFDWPGGGPGVTLTLGLSTGRQNLVQVFSSDDWAMLHFIGRGSPNYRGNTVTLSHQVGQHTSQMRLSFSGANVPFSLPDLRNFRCPTGLR